MSGVELIESGKTVHITKLKSLNRLHYLHGAFDYDVFYGFARFIANKILGYYLAGESLCAEGIVPKEQKEIILRKSVSLINGCFDNKACDIGLPKEIESFFDEIEEMVDGKRINRHSRRATLKDADLLAMRECLGFFINDKNKYSGFWKREYDIAKYYCVSYSDMRFRLQRHSISRVQDILGFVEDYRKIKNQDK